MVVVVGLKKKKKKKKKKNVEGRNCIDFAACAP